MAEKTKPGEEGRLELLAWRGVGGGSMRGVRGVRGVMDQYRPLCTPSAGSH